MNTKRTVDLNMWKTLRECARDTVDKIEDDEEFCIAEFDLFCTWEEEKGFTDDDRDYVVSCGYDLGQFESPYADPVKYQEGWEIILKTIMKRGGVL